MSKEGFTPEESSYFQDLLEVALRRRDVKFQEQAILEMCRTVEFNPLPYIEDLLREMNSKTYLVAVPYSQRASNYRSILPSSGDHEYPYYLRICVNGLDEAQKMLEDLRTDPVTNRELLEFTGILSLKK